MVDQIFKERYAIQKQLGKNAGRRTVLAKDLQTQELVVVKILTFDPDFQWDDIKLFEREAETLQSLSHPAIPHYLDHFEFQTRTTKGFALVQSYIEARSLEDWVNIGRTFNEIELKQVAESLLEILIYLHSQSPPVIHRDIKPSNILLSNRSGNSIGQVYLVDFGSVQTLVRTEGSTMTVVGTYGYMPPEQFGGRAVPASDLYSLGATLIYLATGKHPADLPQEDLRIQFKPKIHLSADFIDWLHWLTEPGLNQRLTAAEEAIKALKKQSKSPTQHLVVGKPIGTKVELKKDQNSLKIIIPPSFWTGNIILKSISIFFRLVYIQLASFTILCFIIVFFNPSVLDQVKFNNIASLLIPTFFVAFITPYFILQSTVLKLDRQKISLSYEWYGILRYRLQPWSLRKNIIKLGIFHRKEERYHMLIRRSIKIWAGTREYKLPTEHLTDEEINWIAYELSKWLDLPITE